MNTNKILEIKKLIKKYQFQIRRYLHSDIDLYLEGLLAIVGLVISNAENSNFYQTKSISKNIKKELKFFIEGSYVLGLEYGQLQKHDQNILEGKAKIAQEITKEPLCSTINKLINISNNPNGFGSQSASKQQYRNDILKAVGNASDYFFKAGKERNE